jgi:hypothetical protein
LREPLRAAAKPYARRVPSDRGLTERNPRRDFGGDCEPVQIDRNVGRVLFIDQGGS